MKRIILYLATNIAIVFVLGIIINILGVDHYLTANGIDYQSLLIIAAIFGFGGSFISLLISKPMAKWMQGVKIIDPNSPNNADEAWIVGTVRTLSERAGISMPEVGIYEGDANAFATGAFKNSALVAVSTGLLREMNHREIEAVLGHEIAHVANGDMVTLTLIQGVVNTFVIFISRIIAFAVDSALRKDGERSSGTSGTFIAVSMICQLVLGILASMIVAWFSRYREFRADAGAANLLGTTAPMEQALMRLGGLIPGALPENMAAMGIAGGIGKLFSSHPPIEKRIEALRNRTHTNI